MVGAYWSPQRRPDVSGPPTEEHSQRPGASKLATSFLTASEVDRPSWAEIQRWQTRREIPGSAMSKSAPSAAEKSAPPAAGCSCCPWLEALQNTAPWCSKPAVPALRSSNTAIPGHLMGKKSVDDTLYGYTNSENVIYPILSGIAKQPEDNVPWAEAAKNFLNLWEETSSTNVRKSREDIPIFNKQPLQTNDYNLKEMVDYLLQFMNMKDETPS
ncbi:gastrin-releasing peptide isoform X1 [Leucoraja erinacea]|uniref:gastrin-releasing peptide isoform X1 n=1 Tax=Leucoraja erinaceus TaxID=7782 RepID=UPI00245697E6|nr:gastrin-releasing peptide isoform X1 [Leucoraja erinacea]